MISIQFPTPGFRTRQQPGFEEIFDETRKLWVKLSPEEWVRQNFISYLVQKANVPSSLISVEKEIGVGELRKRFDIIIYARNGTPWMLVECKAQDVKLTEKTISQMLAYFSTILCPFAFITNGTYTYGWKILNNGFVPLVDFPAYPVVYP